MITYILVHYGWRASFWCSALIGLVAGAIWYLLARDTPREHAWVSTAENALIEAGLPAPDPNLKGERLSWTQIFTNKDLIIVTLSYFSYGYSAFIFFGWFFIYLNEVRGLNLRQSALWSMLPFISMAIGSAAGGWVSDLITRRYGKRAGRCRLATFGIGFAAIFIATATQVASAHTAVIYLAAGAGSLYISQSSFWSVSADIGKKSAGSVSGVMNMGAQTGSAITALLTPFLGEHFGWNTSFLVAAALCALGAVAWLFVDPNSAEISKAAVLRNEPKIESVSE